MWAHTKAHISTLNQACKVNAGAMDSLHLCGGHQMPVIVTPVHPGWAGSSAHSSISKHSATAGIFGKGWSWQETDTALCQAPGHWTTGRPYSSQTLE